MDLGTARLAAELSPQQIEEVRTFFKMFDKRQDGRIAVADIPTVIRAAGQNPTESEIKQLLTECMEDRLSYVDFDQFLEIYAKKLRDTPSNEEELVESFKTFDHEGLGFVMQNELRQMLANLGDVMTEDEIDEFIKESSADPSGRINYEDFAKLMAAKLG